MWPGLRWDLGAFTPWRISPSPECLLHFHLFQTPSLKAGWASSVHLDHSDLFLGLSAHGTLSFVRTQAMPYHCAPELNLGPGANAKRQGAREMVEVKSMPCSCRGPELAFWHPCWMAHQPPVTPAPPGDPIRSSGLWVPIVRCTHTQLK